MLVYEFLLLQNEKIIRSIINASYVTLAVREASHNDTRETETQWMKTHLIIIVKAHRPASRRVLNLFVDLHRACAVWQYC